MATISSSVFFVKVVSYRACKRTEGTARRSNEEVAKQDSRTRFASTIGYTFACISAALLYFLASGP